MYDYDNSKSKYVYYILKAEWTNVFKITLSYIDTTNMHIYTISETKNSSNTHTVTKETKKLAFDTST